MDTSFKCYDKIKESLNKKRRMLQSKYDPIVAVLDFQILILANSLSKSVKIHQNIIYISSQIIGHKYGQILL